MKKLFLMGLVALFIVAPFTVTLASTSCRETPIKIHEVPLPRRNQVRIEWENFTGTWATEKYIFELGNVVTHGNKKFISVRMFDPQTRILIKSGGVAIRNQTRASGVVTDVGQTQAGKKSDDTFVIFRSFKEEVNGRPTNRDIFVVTIRTLKEKIEICEETHHELIRGSVSDYMVEE